jgi:asparagine synthase (glutamine-hydrolysing)
VPFQDNAVVDLALQIPVSRKMPRERFKWLLRTAFGPELPREVLDRKKRPFVGPYQRWIDGPLRELTRDTLAPASVRSLGVLDARQVETLLATYDRGESTAARVLAVLILQLWCERVLRQPTSPSATTPRCTSQDDVSQTNDLSSISGLAP